MQSPTKFRQYAEECKRLAKTAANETDRAALLEIARAWLACAEQAEHKGRPRRTSFADHSSAVFDHAPQRSNAYVSLRHACVRGRIRKKKPRRSGAEV